MVAAAARRLLPPGDRPLGRGRSAPAVRRPGLVSASTPPAPNPPRAPPQWEKPRGGGTQRRDAVFFAVHHGYADRRRLGLAGDTRCPRREARRGPRAAAPPALGPPGIPLLVRRERSGRFPPEPGAECLPGLGLGISFPSWRVRPAVPHPQGLPCSRDRSRDRRARILRERGLRRQHITVPPRGDGIQFLLKDDFVRGRWNRV